MFQYLGPTPAQLIHLFLLIAVNSLTLFAVGILFIRSVWSLAVNTTTIEGWEVDRHRALLRRARILGGYVHGPGGLKVRITRQEFPYDIGIWQNCKQGMGGSRNVSCLAKSLGPAVLTEGASYADCGLAMALCSNGAG